MLIKKLIPISEEEHLKIEKELKRVGVYEVTIAHYRIWVRHVSFNYGSEIFKYYEIYLEEIYGQLSKIFSDEHLRFFKIYAGENKGDETISESSLKIILIGETDEKINFAFTLKRGEYAPNAPASSVNIFSPIYISKFVCIIDKETGELAIDEEVKKLEKIKPVTE